MVVVNKHVILSLNIALNDHRDRMFEILFIFGVLVVFFSSSDDLRLSKKVIKYCGSLLKKKKHKRRPILRIHFFLCISDQLTRYDCASI